MLAAPAGKISERLARLGLQSEKQVEHRITVPNDVTYAQHGPPRTEQHNCVPSYQQQLRLPGP